MKNRYKKKGGTKEIILIWKNNICINYGSNDEEVIEKRSKRAVYKYTEMEVKVKEELK